MLRNAPPQSDTVTDYDLALANHYLRLLAAQEEGAPWEEAASLVLGLDCANDPEHARSVHAAHLARAIWISRCGFMDLLTRGNCDESGKPGPAR
jgi:hypothetical protein